MYMDDSYTYQRWLLISTMGINERRRPSCTLSAMQVVAKIGIIDCPGINETGSVLSTSAVMKLAIIINRRSSKMAIIYDISRPENCLSTLGMYCPRGISNLWTLFFFESMNSFFLSNLWTLFFRIYELIAANITQKKVSSTGRACRPPGFWCLFRSWPKRQIRRRLIIDHRHAAVSAVVHTPRV